MRLEQVQLKPPNISKSHSQEEVQVMEQDIFEKALKEEKNVILLDEGGQTFTSVSFSKFLQQRINMGGHTISFVIGGAYGFSSKMKQRYGTIVSLSALTFAHHLARTVLLEQLYRAFSIINNEPYHNN